MKAAILSIFLSLISFSLDAQIMNKAFKGGEKLVYSGYYNWGFVWVKAGNVFFNTELSNIKDTPQYDINVVCNSLSSWDWFFKMRDTVKVSCDTLSLNPFKSSRIVNEGHHRAMYNYVFDYNKQKIYSQGHNRREKEINKTHPLQAGTMDVLSFAWYVRNIDYNKYNEGEKIPVRLLISNNIYDLYVRYLGEETVKIKSGECIDCYKFSPLLIKGNTFKEGEKMLVWISRDKNRVPIMAQAKVMIGSIKGMLISYEGLRHKTKIFPQSSGCMQ